MSSLCLHAGAEIIEMEQLRDVVTPVATPTWTPVAHHALVDSVKGALVASGAEIVKEEHALYRDGARYFGLLHLGENNDGGNTVIGIRNSHDKSLCVGITAGVNVLVCSNLAFGGTTVLQRRHTSGIDLNGLVEDVMTCLEDNYLTLECSLDRLRDVRLNPDQARAILVQAAEINAIPSCDILPIFREFQEPRHEDFNEPSCWTLLNACTELAHKYSPARADLCHRQLTRLFGLDNRQPVVELLQ